MSKPNFKKHPEFIVKQQTPFNAGPPVNRLAKSHVTPTDLFFVRSHGAIPEVDLNHFRLTVTGRVTRAASFTLKELMDNFKRRHVSATLQCAGNRRAELIASRDIPNELPWGVEAISHADWAGVRLADLLKIAGVESADSSDLHVEFRGLDETERLNQRFNFGGSIPLAKALGDEVLLAYEMNGEPLTPLHGFPLRALVPGFIGARSVKWLEQITVMDEPSQNYFQRHAYRLFAPWVGPGTVDWDEGVMLGEMNVNSVICSHGDGESVQAGPLTVSGYSMAGGGREVARVEVSPDGGSTWMKAELSHHPSPWAWTLWTARLDLKPGKYQLTVRAIDTAINTQPMQISQVWNFKGYMNNAWHRVNILVN